MPTSRAASGLRALEVDRMVQRHGEALAAMEAEAKALGEKHDAEMDGVRGEHGAQVEALKKAHDEVMPERGAEGEAAAEELRAEVRRLGEDHAKEVEALRAWTAVSHNAKCIPPWPNESVQGIVSVI